MMSDDFDDELAEKKPSDEFARMLEASLRGGSAKAKRYSVGDRVRGELLVIGKEECYASLGGNRDGLIQRRDLLDENGQVPYKVGDKIDLFVVQIRGSEVILSPKPTSKNLADDIEDAFDMMIPVEGKVAEVCNGGFRVEIKGKLAFCPISQMDTRRIEQPEEYLGKRFEFQVTKYEEGGRNIVVSRRKLLDEERDAGVGTFASEHRAGDVVRGKVARLEKFGAFVELAPGVDGLAHISELSWTRVNDPAEVLKVGQEVSAKILKIETQAVEGKGSRLRISLSLKDSGADPWVLASQNFAVGTLVTGKVERREPYGLFVKLSDSITGLLPKSKALESPEFPFDKLKVGDTVAVQIGELRIEERRISLVVPKDPGSEDWKGYVAAPAASGGGFGTLGDKLKLAMTGKPKK